MVVVAAVLFASASVMRRFAVVTAAAFTAMLVALLALGNLPQSVNYGAGLVAAIAIAAVVGVRLAVGQSEDATKVVRPLFAAAVVIATVSVSAVVQRTYVRDRYSGSQPLPRLFAVVEKLEHKRIGVAGHGFQYPFFGPDFTNSVNYVGVTGPAHSFEGPGSCAALLSTLMRLHDDFVVLEPLPVEHTDRLAGWLQAIPGVEVVFGNTAGTVYKMPAVIPADACAPAPTA
jgi:hypothetical protein